MYRVIRLHALTLAATVTALMFLPGLPPYEIEFDAIPLTPNKPFDGTLTKNELLNSGQIISEKVDGSSLGYFRVSSKRYHKIVYTITSHLKSILRSNIQNFKSIYLRSL